jgi:hypothetical protein
LVTHEKSQLSPKGASAHCIRECSKTLGNEMPLVRQFQPRIAQSQRLYRIAISRPTLTLIDCSCPLPKLYP